MEKNMIASGYFSLSVRIAPVFTCLERFCLSFKISSKNRGFALIFLKSHLKTVKTLYNKWVGTEINIQSGIYFSCFLVCNPSISSLV